MIKKLFLGVIAALTFVAFQPSAQAALEIGKDAPTFTVKDSNGKSHNLADFKGKVVVLEWNNPDCPFVVKQYESGNMQKLQETYTAKDVIWLTINSGAEGKQGYLNDADANKFVADQKAKPTAYLLDHNGLVGKAYDALVTPHMFVIDKEGKLVYNGAIDDNDSAKAADALTAKNYVAAALDSILAGTPVEVAQTKPYGCGVKY